MNGDPKYYQAIERFQELLERVQQISLREPMATTLATCDTDGQPSARVVLLRGFDERGFVFFTNSHSRKGQQLALNPRAALCFYWDELHEQVRVEGRVEHVEPGESDTYWSKRHRLSQLSSCVSRQSERLDSRLQFEDAVARLEDELAGRPVPRPPHWFGYRLVPHRIEFWSGRDGRMHDRVVYEWTVDGWETYRLFP